MTDARVCDLMLAEGGGDGRAAEPVTAVVFIRAHNDLARLGAEDVRFG
jgi:hypothetical protein